MNGGRLSLSTQCLWPGLPYDSTQHPHSIANEIQPVKAANELPSHVIQPGTDRDRILMAATLCSEAVESLRSPGRLFNLHGTAARAAHR